jgi:hypothetical protein
MKRIKQYSWDYLIWRISIVLFVIGFNLSATGGIIMLFSNDGDASNGSRHDCEATANCKPVEYVVSRATVRLSTVVSTPILPTITPTPRNSSHDSLPTKLNQPSCLICTTRSTRQPPIIDDTLNLLRSRAIRDPSTTQPTNIKAESLSNNQETELSSNNQEAIVTSTGCSGSSSASFELLPVESSAIDHPARYHADLNLALRGYVQVNAPLEPILYNGQTAADPPRISGLFEPNRTPQIIAAYQINHWQWDCPTNAHGCRGTQIQDWEVTMVGLASAPGEAIYIPERMADIYQGRFQALVLYASEQQITLGYTRRDSVTLGYVIHVEGVCVDSNLLALYWAQNNQDGWRHSHSLPGLGNNQPFGTASGQEIRVAIRDNGTFLDPRSSKDWW